MKNIYTCINQLNTVELIKETAAKIGAGTDSQSQSVSSVTPNRKRLMPTSPTGRCRSTLLSSRKKKTFHQQSSQSETVAAQPMRSLYTLDS